MNKRKSDVQPEDDVDKIGRECLSGRIQVVYGSGTFVLGGRLGGYPAMPSVIALVALRSVCKPGRDTARMWLRRRVRKQEGPLSFDNSPFLTDLLAGVVGFEPTRVGFRIRCLNRTWLYPSQSGAVGETRTLKVLTTATSTLRVYQFRHDRETC